MRRALMLLSAVCGRRYAWAHPQLAPEGARLTNVCAVFRARDTNDTAEAYSGTPMELDGYTLVPSYRGTANSTGYHCVAYEKPSKRHVQLNRPYVCIIESSTRSAGAAKRSRGLVVRLGNFHTAVEAALAYAKHVGKAAAASEAAKAHEINDRRAATLTVEAAQVRGRHSNLRPCRTVSEGAFEVCEGAFEVCEGAFEVCEGAFELC